MKITADTNLLVRAITGDDPVQAKLAQDALRKAEAVVLTSAALCELVWVLTKGYREAPADVAGAVRKLLNAANVIADRQAIEAGLALLEHGGDFADGVIAFEGAAAGAECFLSFDRDAVKRVRQAGLNAMTPGRDP